MSKKSLLHFFLSLCLAVGFFATKANAHDGHDKRTNISFTVDSQTDESCAGNADGTITYTVSGIVGSSLTVVLGSTTISGVQEQVDFTNITNGTVTGTYSNLSPGTYFIQYLSSSSQFGSSNSIVINAYDLAVQITPTSPTCFGDADGVLNLAGSGGTAPYTYSVNGSRFQSVGTFSALSADSYTVVIEDATGCQVTETIELTQPDAVAATAVATAATCNGSSTGSITVTATGGDGNYTYSTDGTNFQASATLSSLAAGTYTITVKDGNDCSTTVNATVGEPAVVTASITATTDVTCNGADDGTVTFSFSGGNGIYEARFRPSTGGSFLRSVLANGVVTGLEPGVYYIDVFDSNICNTSTLNATITEPDLLEIEFITGQLFACAGNTTTLTVTEKGGTGPYMYSSDGGTTFQSSNVFPNLVAGTYDFTVMDANNCTAQASTFNQVQVTALDQISANLVTEDISCFGANDGTITVNETSGGIGGNYQYSIDGTNFQSSNVFSGLTPGSYTVSIVDSNNCTATLTTSITEPQEATVSVNITNGISCNGATDASIEIVTSNTITPVSYTLDNGSPQASNVFDNLAAGSYNITVTHGPNNCFINTTVNITEPTAISISPTSSDVSCNGGSDGSITLQASGGTGNYTFTLTGNNYNASGASNAFSGLSAGTYTATVADDSGCDATTSITINESTAISVTHLAVAPSCVGGADGRISINLGSGGTGGLQIRLQGTTTLSSQIQNLSAGDYTVETVDQNGCTVTSVVTIPDAAPLTADVTVDANASGCGNSDGAFTVSNVRKGTLSIPSSEYSIDGSNYQSSPSFTGLAAGVYTLSIRDITPANNGTGNCDGTVTVTITEPSGITATITPTHLLCAGDTNGSIDITNVSGGTAPYSYSIDGTNFGQTTSFTGLNSDRYTIHIRDNAGCTLIQSVDVNEPAAISATVAATDITCNGAGDGEINITASGGTGTLQYSIDGTNFQTGNQFTGLASGSYSITVVDDNACSTQLQATVNEPATLSAAFVGTTNVTCNGGNDGTATLSVTGGTTPYQVSIDGTQFFPVPPGGTFPNIGAIEVATVLVRDANGCEITIPGFTITEPDALDANFNVTQAICKGDDNASITIVPVSTSASGFEYSIDGTNFSTNDTFTQLAPGQYTITMRDAGTGCSNTFNVTVTEPDTLEAFFNVVDLSCHDSQDGQILSAVSGGVAPYEYSLEGTNFQSTDFTGLAAGSYTITVRDANGCTATNSVSIGAPNALLIEASQVTDATCNGANDGSAAVNANGGTMPYTYSLDGTNFSSTIDLTQLSAGSYIVTVKDANDCESQVSFTIAEPVAIQATVVNNSVTCNGSSDGSLTVNASAGAGGFTYSIDGTNFGTTNTFDNLAAGAYIITVMNAQGCTITLNEDVTEPDALTLQIEAVDITCNGDGDGQLAGAASGGTAPYTYSIDGTNFQSTAFTGLQPGTYTLTAKDANDCETTQSVVISEPDLLQASLTSSTNVTCNGGTDGSIAVTGTGGSSPYTYSIDGTNFINQSSFADLAAGSYTVTIKDANDCSTTVSATIIEPDALSASATGSSLTCNGDSNGTISATASGGTAPYEYSLDGNTFQSSNAFGSLTTGSYTITIKDANDCTTTATASVTEPTALSVSIVATDVTCNDDADGSIAVTATGGTGTLEYSTDGTNFQAGSSFGSLTAGSYTITVRDANGCTTTTSAMVAEPSAITVSTTVTDATCNGDADGAIAVTATGGSGTLEYSIDGTNFQAGSSFGSLTAGNYTITVRDANGCSTTTSATVDEPTALSVSTTVTDATCNGDADGSLAVTATGGTGTLEYSIDGTNFQAGSSFGSLAAGSYTITVRDVNGCTATGTATVSEPTALSVSTTIMDATCNGDADGAIAVTATGGSGTLEYSIDGTNFQAGSSFNSIAAGSYTITVRDANGCTITTSAKVDEPTALSVSTTVMDATCTGDADGAIAVTASGGTGTLEYSIDGTNFQAGSSFGSLATGSYTITVRDANGCTGTTSVSVAEPSAITVSTTITDATCNGDANGAIVVTAAGGTGTLEYSLDGTNFQSSADFNNLAADSYTVTVRDANGCTATAMATVAEPTALIVTATITNDNTITASASGGTGTYEYAIDGSNFQSSGVFSDLVNGNYTITTRDANGCTATTSQNLIITSTDGPFAPVYINLYPNPTADYVRISGLELGDEILLINPSGKAVGQVTITTAESEYEMTVTSYREGMYILAVNNKSGIRKSSKKLIIKR